MLDFLEKEINEMMKKPDVIAVALVYSLLKPTVMKHLGLESGESQQLPQALPQQIPHGQDQQFSTYQQNSPHAQIPQQPQSPQQQNPQRK